MPNSQVNAMLSALGRWKQIIVVIDWAFLMFCIYDYYSGHRFLGSYDSTAIVVCAAVMLLFVKVISPELFENRSDDDDIKKDGQDS